MPEPDVSFVLEDSTFNKIKNAASALGHSEMSIGGNKELLTLSVADNQNVTSNKFSIDVDGTSKSDNFNFVINIPNMKILPGDYEVSISSKLISNFKIPTRIYSSEEHQRGDRFWQDVFRGATIDDNLYPPLINTKTVFYNLFFNYRAYEPIKAYRNVDLPASYTGDADGVTPISMADPTGDIHAGARDHKGC